MFFVDGLCRRCHREEKGARSGERGHRRATAKIQSGTLQTFDKLGCFVM